MAGRGSIGTWQSGPLLEEVISLEEMENRCHWDMAEWP